MGMKKFKMLNVICTSCELSSKEKLVAQYFVYKSNKEGSCYPAVETIAKQCGVSERTIQRATKKLQEIGFISIEKRFANRKQISNLYKFNLLLIEELEREKDVKFEEKTKMEEEVNIKEISLEEQMRKCEVNQEYIIQINSNLDGITKKEVDMWDINMVMDLDKECFNKYSEEYDYDLLDYQLTSVKKIDSYIDNKGFKQKYNGNYNKDILNSIDDYEEQDNIVLGKQNRKEYKRINIDIVNKNKTQSRLVNENSHMEYKEEREFYAWRNEYMKCFGLNSSITKCEEKKLINHQINRPYKICKNIKVGIKNIEGRSLHRRKYLYNKSENIKVILFDLKATIDFWKSYLIYGDGLAF